MNKVVSGLRLAWAVRLTAAGTEAWADEIGVAKERAVGNGVMTFAPQLFVAGGASDVGTQKGAGLLFQNRLLGRLQQRLRLSEGQAQLFDPFASLAEQGDIDHTVCLPIVVIDDELKFELHVCYPLLRADSS